MCYELVKDSEIMMLDIHRVWYENEMFNINIMITILDM